MFGYTAKPDQRVACALCKTIGTDFTHIQRFALSNDVSLLANLLLSLSDRDISTFRKGHCFSPQTHGVLTEQILSFCAAINSWMISVKWNDTIQDSAHLPDFLSLGNSNNGNAINRLAAFGVDKKFVQDQLDTQMRYEQDEVTDPRLASSPTAQIVGHLLSTSASIIHRPELTEQLGEIGRLLGRLIYLEDAVRDMDEDMESGNYNPFLIQGVTKQQARNTVTQTHHQLTSAVRVLPAKTQAELQKQYDIDNLFRRSTLSTCTRKIKRFNWSQARTMAQKHISNHQHQWLAYSFYVAIFFLMPHLDSFLVEKSLPEVLKSSPWLLFAAPGCCHDANRAADEAICCACCECGECCHGCCCEDDC